MDGIVRAMGRSGVVSAGWNEPRRGGKSEDCGGDSVLRDDDSLGGIGRAESHDELLPDRAVSVASIAAQSVTKWP